ncbi:ATPase component of ABC-type sugar transporter [Desulfosporosinus orientis DSM 765]|uniref:ATPase component of ABC-type sugar transporter n=1 Tax=Desulfosporosinus orientis (strain ATCC 19365 / DSM 765 / NCIMB 8382 / VKM B-1628 / Singapore I) TaxID=768706 RepID=G7WER3_DESOD|nr:ATP-binding cassette domain-containing protein [Desulfosporosinus orientis]AET66954.1 ATPase component of ABC-type sugar transporter [Desulfosporosinus orientis DSM 765]
MLEAQEITWKQDHKTILQSINFHLLPGECVGLIGPNGSGKSSLLKILAFLETPTSGLLFFQGQSVPKNVPLAIRRKIAIVFQESLLLNTRVFDNVAVGLKIRGVSKETIKQRVDYWLEQFGVIHLSKQLARSLSGGEAQRVSLARAFAIEPDVLFLDEPFSALDAPTKEALRVDLAKVFKTTQTTTVLVSHDFKDIAHLANRAMILLNGQVAAEGAPTELLQNPQQGDVTRFLAHFTS